MALHLHKAESKGTPWVGGYFASGEDAIKVASKGEMGAILQSPTVGAHMVTITPIKTKPGKFRVQDTGVGKTYDVDSNWIEKFVSAGVWRNE